MIANLCVLVAPAQQRRWADKTGKYSVDAELVELKQDSVVLKRASGRTVTVPIARLSETDRRYLKSIAQPAGKSPGGNGTGKHLAYPDAVTQPPRWNDANPPFDLADFLTAPPVQENAAPLYLDAFCEFHFTMEFFFPELTEDEKRQKFLNFRPRNNKLYEFERAWERNPKSLDFNAVDAWLTEHDVGFQKIAAAQARPKCIFQTGRKIDSYLVHTWVARRVATIVQWRVRLDVNRNELDRPIQDVETLLRLSRDLKPRGSTQCQVVSNRLESLYCCTYLVPAILGAPSVNIRHCDRLLALLAEHEAQSIDAFQEANRADYFCDRQALHDLQHRTGNFDPLRMKQQAEVQGDVTSPLTCIKLLVSLTNGSRLAGEKYGELARSDKPLNGDESEKITLLPGAWSGGKLLSDGDYANEAETLNRVYASFLALSARPELTRTGDIAMVIDPLCEPLRATTLAVFFAGYRDGLLHSIRSAETNLWGTRCLIALRRWQLEHTEPPKDIETLVKAAGISSVPIDPWSGQPFRMALLDGKPVIYSIGPDQKDDGAKVEWNQGYKQPGDVIFRLN
jgi:hypothetical protein